MLKIDRARWDILQRDDLAFYATLTMQLTDKIGLPKGAAFATACTDGRHIYWGEEFLAKLTPEETRFVLMHEALHCAHLHAWRLPTDALGNQAADHAINLILQSLPGCKMPEGGLADPRFCNMAEEEILTTLRAEQRKPKAADDGSPSSPPGPSAPGDGDPGDGDPGDGDPGGCGGFMQPGEGSEEGSATSEQLQDEWISNVVQADMASRSTGRGAMPSGLQRLIGDALAPRINWKAEMADFVRTQVQSKNDWSRSCRRMATAPVIYPRRVTDQTGRVIFIRDTSGSVNDYQISEFNGMIRDSMRETGCGAYVIDADAQVNAEYEVDDADSIPPKAVGGGGTDFRPVFRRIRELAEGGMEIAGVVYITDLDGDEPTAADVDHELLWVCTTNRVAGTGRTVPIR